MKKIYSNPGISIKQFEAEELLTASGGSAVSKSAEEKASKALEAMGTTFNTTVSWDE